MAHRLDRGSGSAAGPGSHDTCQALRFAESTPAVASPLGRLEQECFGMFLEAAARGLRRCPSTAGGAPRRSSQGRRYSSCTSPPTRRCGRCAGGAPMTGGGHVVTSVARGSKRATARRLAARLLLRSILERSVPTDRARGRLVQLVLVAPGAGAHPRGRRHRNPTHSLRPRRARRRLFAVGTARSLGLLRRIASSRTDLSTSCRAVPAVRPLAPCRPAAVLRSLAVHVGRPCGGSVRPSRGVLGSSPRCTARVMACGSPPRQFPAAAAPTAVCCGHVAARAGVGP